MARCPVCKTECNYNESCPRCGFDEIEKTFVNRDEAELWEKQVLIPYAEAYNISLIGGTQGVNLDVNGALTSCGISRRNKRIILPYGTNHIGESCFWGSYQTKMSEIHIPNTVKSIGERAFAFCHLKSIFIPDSVITLEPEAFVNSYSLEYVRLPLYIDKIPRSLFNSCVKLKEIHIPNAVSTIEEYAFFNCQQIDSVNISTTVIEIKDFAFASCGFLGACKFIIIPESVVNMGSEIFDYSNFDVFCEVKERPVGWDKYWNLGHRGVVYWGNEWHYENGIPVPNERKTKENDLKLIYD